MDNVVHNRLMVHFSMKHPAESEVRPRNLSSRAMAVLSSCTRLEARLDVGIAREWLAAIGSY